MRSLRVVVFGATGTAGSEVVRQCLADPRIAEVRAVTRRPLGFTHEKLREVRCQDFEDLSPIGGALEGVDACFFCLGISQAEARDEQEYRRITVGYALAAARALKERSPGHTFHYLSGVGADPTGRSWMMWARVKGEAENELSRLGLRRLFCLRPGYIHPEPEHRKPGAAGAIGQALYPVMRVTMPRITIRAVELARAMIELSLSDEPGGTLENARLLELGRR